MTRRDPWFKFYPADWLANTRLLTLEQRGAYIDCICMQMQQERALPDDYAWLAHQMHVSKRKAQSIVEELIGLQKFQRTEAGLTNERCETEIAARLHQRHVNSEIAAAREVSKRESAVKLPRASRETSVKVSPKICEKSKLTNEIKDTPTNSCDENSTILDIRYKKEERRKEREEGGKGNLAPSDGANAPALPLEALQAFHDFNDLAQRIGLRVARTLTPGRRKLLCARLREHGTASWQIALVNIERSSFLRGNNNRGWSADLDFVLQARSYAKLVDGGYGNGAHAKVDDHDGEDYMARMARLLGVPEDSKPDIEIIPPERVQ